MKKSRLLLAAIPLIMITALLSCQKDGHSSEADSRIDHLNTPEKQKDFLIEIGESDQFVRQNMNEQINMYGYESPQHREAIGLMVRTDSTNLAQVEKYLRLYGHPKVEIHGTKATDVPIMVIHHAMGGMAPRLRNFNYLYEAYQEGELESTSFSFYLNRMYKIKYGEMIKWDRPFTEQEELDTLLRALDLPQELTIGN